VLSVVANMIQTILDHIDCEHFEFMGGPIIKMRPSTAIFVTMNPGYAGRSELPDNLKVLFRPVSMMVADCGKICDIFLKAMGFQDSDVLSKKVASLYELMNKQLSVTSHYDFKLRAIISALKFCG
jgi:dynein heavy chain